MAKRRFVDEIPEGSTPFGTGGNHTLAPDGTWYTNPHTFWNRTDKPMERGPGFEPESQSDFVKRNSALMAGAIGGAGLIGAATGGAGAAGGGAAGAGGSSAAAGASMAGKGGAMAGKGVTGFLNSPLGQQLLGTGLGMLGGLIEGDEETGVKKSFADLDDDDPRKQVVDPVQNMYNAIRSTNLLAQSFGEKAQQPTRMRQPTLPGFGGQGQMNIGGFAPTSSGLDLSKFLEDLRAQMPAERAPMPGQPNPQAPSGGGGGMFERMRRENLARRGKG